jgi:hypothetical protein
MSTADMDDVEDFDPNEWNIGRKGRQWTHEEFERRIYQAPEKIEFTDGIFTYERERMIVLAMLLENLGIDKAVRLGNPADWKAALAELEQNTDEHER